MLNPPINVICTRCGKKIPFGAEVCPYCKRSAVQSQAQQIRGMVLVGFGGFIGLLAGGFGSAILGAVAGGALWVVVEIVQVRSRRK
jgi:hypothetical protein